MFKLIKHKKLNKTLKPVINFDLLKNLNPPPQKKNVKSELKHPVFFFFFLTSVTGLKENFHFQSFINDHTIIRVPLNNFTLVVPISNVIISYHVINYKCPHI